MVSPGVPCGDVGGSLVGREVTAMNVVIPGSSFEPPQPLEEEIQWMKDLYREIARERDEWEQVAESLYQALADAWNWLPADVRFGPVGGEVTKALGFYRETSSSASEPPNVNGRFSTID